MEKEGGVAIVALRPPILFDTNDTDDTVDSGTNDTNRTLMTLMAYPNLTRTFHYLHSNLGIPLGIGHPPGIPQDPQGWGILGSGRV